MTVEENLKLHYGNLIFQIAMLQTELQQTKDELARLKTHVDPPPDVEG